MVEELAEGKLSRWDEQIGVVEQKEKRGQDVGRHPTGVIKRAGNLVTVGYVVHFCSLASASAMVQVLLSNPTSASAEISKLG